MKDKLCFYVIGEDFTALVRSIWADEQNPERAMRILEGGLPEMDAGDRFAILVGSKKLEGDSREGGLQLVDDKAEKTRLGTPLSFTHLLERIREKQVSEVEYLEEVIKARNEEIVSWENTVDGMAEAFFPEEEEEKPTPPPEPQDKISHRFGWLSPEGRFYRCEWMEHIWLARALGSSEVELENKGWIKIEKGEAFIPDKAATQRQLDLIFDFYAKDGREMPEWTRHDEYLP